VQDIQAQVLGVSGRGTRTGKTVYDVALSDGNKYSTFNPDVATKANNLVGQNVSARVEVKQNGQYTNYNLEDIAQVGQLAPLALPPGTPLGAPNTGGVGVPVAGPPIPIQQGRGNDPEREARIVRQSSASTAFGLVGRLFEGAGPEAYEQAVEQAKKLAAEIAAWALGAPQAAQAPQTPQEVAAAVPGVQVGTENVQPAQAVPQW
jgi:hypothetical protein